MCCYPGVVGRVCAETQPQESSKGNFRTHLLKRDEVSKSRFGEEEGSPPSSFVPSASLNAVK